MQTVLEGTAPEKLQLGQGAIGLDLGVSTMAYDGEEKAGFLTLAPEARRYWKAAEQAAAVYERRRRMANPQNYNPDGTARRDTKAFQKHWNRTKGMQEALMRLKTACRKQSVYIKNSHGFQTNRIAESGSTLIKEPMDYKALARRAKKPARQSRESAVNKEGRHREAYI